MTGRFAPSPTGPLHVGNLRTALLAWLCARSSNAPFLVRMEDLDRVTSSLEHETRQLEALASLGLDHDGEVLRQSERFDRYAAAIAELTSRDLTYECYCSRREIREAASAPHAPELRYPGTCRDLDGATRARRRRERPAALRLRSPGEPITVVDELAGPFRAAPDDVVLRRNDGVASYNVAVVVDDAAQGVAQVVRGDDLLASTPRQVLLQSLLGLPTPRYAHVPLVVGDDGVRLAKRHGAITLEELGDVARGRLVGALAASLGLVAPGTPVTTDQLVATFDLGLVVARGRAPVRLSDLRRSWS